MRYIFSFILVISAYCVMGQSLPNDQTKFIKEYDKLVRQSTSEDLKVFIYEELEPMLNSGQFPDEYFSKMVSTANSMMEKRMKVFPDVQNYIFSMYSLVKENQPKSSYTAWHNTVDKLLSGRNTRRFTDFIEVSGAFFSQGIIALNANYEWLVVGGDYAFTYDKQPEIEFTNGKLVCRTINRSRSKGDTPYSDSLVLNGVTGTYELTKERWIGSGGQMNWEKVGLNAEETFAKLTSYQISMKSTNFTCDTVFLTTPYFSTEVPGKLTDRAQRGGGGSERELPFPQFQSYERKYTIADFLPGVDYLGGFSLQGSEFVGEGTTQEPAQLTFYKEGSPFIRTKSSQVRVKDNRLMTESCYVYVALSQRDSIIHPGLSLRYEEDSKILTLSRKSSGLSQAPFINSFHQLDMYVEQLVWDKSKEELDLNYNFSTSQQQRQARFESFDFYDERLFQKLQGMASVNPLTAIWDYAYKYDKYVFNEGTAATALGMVLQQAKPTLLDLSALGFIAYDTERGIVSVNQKLEHFVMSKSGKKDFDNLIFVSDLTPKRFEYSDEEVARNPALQELKERLEKRNKERSVLKSFGRINLKNLDLELSAVDNVPISQQKKTTIFPEGDFITVRKNRSIIFKGWINAGKWEVNVLAGDYNYEENKFHILESDASLFRAKPLREEDGERPIPLQSAIAGIKGELIVDDVNNRSGLNETFNAYPKLLSKEKTKVYYDHRSIHRGAYEKESFYFEVEPFELDSLANFEEKKLRIAGELTSAGIFPKFKQELKLMPDYSLGFSTETPKEGYKFYEMDATYDNQIALSNNGLQGNGQIDFINSSSISKLFTFLPDSTIGVAKFENRPQLEGVEFPDAKGENTFITYLPRKKVLKVRSNESLIDFFNGEASLRGEAIIRESGMRGSGLVNIKGDANMSSKNYVFKRWEMNADTANFNLVNNKGSLEEQADAPLAVKTDNMKAKLNFKDRVGDFVSNDGTSTIDFPVNKYLCKIDMFTWFMDTEDIELKESNEDVAESDDDLDLAGPNFISTHPKQDSLSFRSKKARFNLKEKTIYCSETEFIDVADARIYPDSAKVTIRKNAEMDKLENSIIVANYITKYHRIENASTAIKGKRAYTSSGDYFYYDRDSTKHIFHFPKITLDSSYQTVASGKIGQEIGFKLSPEFDFYGDVRMKAAAPHLLFEGATRINHECDKFDRNWMSFQSSIDPNNIQIPVSEKMMDLDGNNIAAGIVWHSSEVPDEVELYPTFLSEMRNPDDAIVLTANGYLQYNVAASEFQIGQKEKLVNRNESGNFISLHTKSCSMNGDGNVNLGMDFGTVEMAAVGIVNYNQESQETTMNLTVKVSAPVDTKIMEDVGKKIVNVEGLKPAEFSSTTIEQSVLEWVGREEADKFKEEYTLEKEVKRIPKKMQELFVISGIQMTSHKNLGDEPIGLKTTTDNAALVSIYGQPIMKTIPTKLFLQKRQLIGDKFGLLIDVPGAYSYYFDLDNRKTGTMNILSNDGDFTSEINNLKPEKRKERKFEYQITDNSAYKSQFLRVFN